MARPPSANEMIKGLASVCQAFGVVAITSSVIAPNIQNLEVSPEVAAYWLITGVLLLVLQQVFLYHVK